MKKTWLLVVLVLIAGWTAFADGSNKKSRDVGYSGGDFYSVEYEEIDNKAYFSILVTFKKDNSKLIARMFSQKKDKIKELYDNPSTPDQLLMVLLSYSNLFEVVEETETKMIYEIDLDAYNSNSSGSGGYSSDDSIQQFEIR